MGIYRGGAYAREYVASIPFLGAAWEELCVFGTIEWNANAHVIGFPRAFETSLSSLSAIDDQYSPEERILPVLLFRAPSFVSVSLTRVGASPAVGCSLVIPSGACGTAAPGFAAWRMCSHSSPR